MLKKGLILLCLLSLCNTLPAFCESQTTSSVDSTAPPQGYSMLAWLNAMTIVEQLQVIHRYAQSTSPTAISGLMSALDSTYPLARRKASRSLLEMAQSADPAQKQLMAKKLGPSLANTDPVVQKNMVRLMADLRIPEAQNTLKHFFVAADMKAQLTAVDALKECPKNLLLMAKQATPYTEVREAIAESLL
jgi:hypothetical protein